MRNLQGNLTFFTHPFSIKLSNISQTYFLINPFYTYIFFLYPLKTSENQRLTSGLLDYMKNIVQKVVILVYKANFSLKLIDNLKPCSLEINLNNF